MSDTKFREKARCAFDKDAVSVIGLGKLGAPMAAVFAAKGFRVVGVDTNDNNVQLINSGQAPFFEPELENLLIENRDLISATSDCAAAITDTSITFVVVPTPSDKLGQYSTTFLKHAANQIGASLARKTKWHLVVLTSTVCPGSTEREFLPVIEEASGKTCGDDFGLCYNPEFIALGSVIQDLLHPDFILVGAHDQRSGHVLAAFYEDIVDNAAPIVRMNIINAEIAKLSVNSFITTKISFANTLAELCERLPGADCDMVSAAIGMDSRIGPKYLKGSVAYGGPCFPRDNAAFAAAARAVGVQATIAEATDQVNYWQSERLFELIRRNTDPASRVCILGLAYKPGTPVIEKAPGLELAQKLRVNGYELSLYDPLALANVRKVFGRNVRYAINVNDCVKGSDAIVITLPDPELRFGPESLDVSSETFILDCWRLLDGPSFNGVARYNALGREWHLRLTEYE